MNKNAKKGAVAVLGGVALIGFEVFRRVVANRYPPKYSPEWIRSLSDEQWETEREIVRLEYIDPERDFDTAARMQNLLDLFDRIKSERDGAGQTSSGGRTYRREHGYNLYKPD